MYAEDMMEADGCGGLPPAPKVSDSSLSGHGKVSVIEKIKPEANSSLSGNASNEVGQRVITVERPSDSLSDQREQRQYHEFTAYQPPLQQEDPLIIQPGRSRSSGRSRRSQSPGTRRRSLTPSRRNSGSMNSYQLMPMEMDTSSENPNRKKLPRRLSSSLLPGKRSKSKQEIEDEKYEAQVALVIQMAMVFFCVLISVATFLSIGIAIFTNHGYWVVILLCVALLVILVLSLCCFLFKVVNEEDAPSVNERHMPKWYRTLRKIVKDELADFREDWMNMVNNVYLLEDGVVSSFIPNPPMEEGDFESSPQIDNNQAKPKKRRGKSTLFKLVAKPAAILASFRRKRKDKRKQKKPTPFPSTMV